MKKIILLFLLLFGVGNLFAQEQNGGSVTGVPFLLISADARASGMGNLGVATAPDVFSQQWNPAKYPFSENKLGIGLSYTPYLSSMSNDIALLNLNYFNKINERSTYALSLRYFGLGETVFKQNESDQGQAVTPNELAFDGSYSLKLSETFSMSVTGRYIRSDLKIQEVDATGSVASTFAVDIAGYYQSKEISFKNFQGIWRGGFNLSNLGPKLNYDVNSGSESALPTNLKLGGGFDFILDQDNTLGTSIEFNKLFADDSNSITGGLGLEYVYQQFFALRTGFYNDNNGSGNHNFFTVGAGFKYKTVKFDLSYLNSTSKQASSEDNMLRFSLSFNIGDSPASNVKEEEKIVN
ncbi:type IX secretion system outer membrane channel protein PorV [Flavobacterium sp. N3904]|uniref:type IX secretion system outer membrane channel protein PorV n=1 Tax=Flavobacterium sp. N3904 TaxID=2986835 RepID=UPI0022249CB7|nr:type IX secretion system outer membrane channel protein PorV [Flavobacterium sp. N3904]